MKEKKKKMHEPWSVCPKLRSTACRLHEKCYKWIHQNMHAMVHKHGLFQAEKRSGTMKVVQKFKTSSLKSVVPEHMGFGQKWLSEPWGPNGKYMSVT